MRIITTTPSAKDVPTQLTHQLEEGVAKNKMDRIHKTNCIGVPKVKKSFVCTVSKS